MYLTFRDVIHIIIKSLLITSLVVVFYFLVCMNCNIANYICNITDIPKGMALSVMSPGFYNELVIITSVFEIGFILYIENILLKYPKISKLYEQIYYL